VVFRRRCARRGQRWLLGSASCRDETAPGIVEAVTADPDIVPVNLLCFGHILARCRCEWPLKGL
jgi:hypothetical protein